MTTDSELARLYAKACEAMARLFYEFELGAKLGDYDTDAASISEFLTAFASRLESPAQSEDAMAAALVDSLDGEGRARADGLTSARLAEIVSDGPAACYNDPWAVKQERIELAKEVVFLRHAYHSTAAALDATCEREESERAALATPVGLRPCHHGMNTIECPMCSKALAAPTTHPEGDVVEALLRLADDWHVKALAVTEAAHGGFSNYAALVAERDAAEDAYAIARRAALTPNPTTPQTEAKP